MWVTRSDKLSPDSFSQFYDIMIFPSGVGGNQKGVLILDLHSAGGHKHDAKSAGCVLQLFTNKFAISTLKGDNTSVFTARFHGPQMGTKIC